MKEGAINSTMQNSEFPQFYRWEILQELPPGRKVVAFPPDSSTVSFEFLVEITPDEGESWIGNFTGSGLDLSSGVFPTPKSKIVCINSQGAVYFVNVISPLDSIEAPFSPVIEVDSFYQDGLLLLIGFTRVTIFDKEGIRWTIKVSKDGIKINHVSKEKIMGLAWDPGKDRYVNFEIDIKSGKLLGGSAY
jgi:hypothetical protein